MKTFYSKLLYGADLKNFSPSTKKGSKQMTQGEVI